MKLAIRQNQVYFDSCGDCREAGVDRCPLIEVGRSYHSFGAGILSHVFFTRFALCLYQFLKVLLMSLEESKIVWRLCLTGVL